MRDMPVCEECGYELTGIGEGMDWTQCPECGEPFVVSMAWRRSAWWPRIVLEFGAMCGPLFVLLIGAYATEATWHVTGAGAMVVFVCAIVAIVPPALIAGRVAERRCLRAWRGPASWGIAAAAMAINIAVSVITLRLL